MPLFLIVDQKKTTTDVNKLTVFFGRMGHITKTWAME